VKKVYPPVELQDILAAFADVLKRVEHTTHHRILREPLSVRERMSAILTQLSEQSLLAFQKLFIVSEGRAGAVVSLLAILELSKERLIDIIQSEPLAELHIRAAAAS
jgi:segregation and condensation protein A